MNKHIILDTLKNTLDSYYPISTVTWNKLQEFCEIKTISKKEHAFDIYNEAKYISYIYKGLFRAYTTNEEGEELNKNFFWENRFYGPMVALLTNTEITSSVQALEDTIIVNIDFKKYRELLFLSEDLKSFHILYLEKHWIIDKNEDKDSFVLEDAKQRYTKFLKTFSHILPRLSQLNIALYLGISPTHLSRIKKEL